MRIFLTALTVILLLTGCSKTTAFDFFKMDEEHERAVTNLRTETIVRSFETKAIVSTIYLNHALPDKYSGDEYFFVSLYLQDDMQFFDPHGVKEPNTTLTLNGEVPAQITLLREDDLLRALMPIKNEWNQYYLVHYPYEAGDKLTLTLESDRYGKVELMYRKDVE